MVKIQFILGSTREGRVGGHVFDWLKDVVAARKDLDAEFIDLNDVDLPFFNDPLPPSRGVYSFDYTKKWAAKVAEADGYVMVCPEYNHGYPAVLKNAIDHLYKEWNHKPAGFVSYGAMSGGIRAVEQLRQVVIELRMVPIRETVAIPGAYRAFDDNGNLQDREGFDAQAGKMLDELVWWAESLAKVRASDR